MALRSGGPTQVFVAKVQLILGQISSVQVAQKANITLSYQPPIVTTETLFPAPKPPPLPIPLQLPAAMLDMINVFLVPDKAELIPAPQEVPESIPAPSEVVITGYFPAPVPLSTPQTTNPTVVARSKIIGYFQSQILYLGTCEVPPIISIRRNFRSVYSIDSGKQVPYDKIYTGQDAIVRMNLNNWNEATYYTIAAQLNANKSGGGPRGVDLQDSIGDMLLTENFAFMLILQNPNAAKLVMQNAAMPAGYRFFASYPMDEMLLQGTRPNNLRLNWHCMKVFDFATSNQWLFDHDMSMVPQLTSVYA